MGTLVGAVMRISSSHLWPSTLFANPDHSYFSYQHVLLYLKDINPAEMNVYDAWPLDPQQREIRLLHLLPGSQNEPIETKLSRVSLEKDPAFNVLSYSWGSENDKITIKVEGWELRITQNLHRCLVNLRQETTPLVIWIDAVCINQDSNQEKNTQVPLMRDIYKSAEQAYVWLGETSSELDLIFSSIGVISREGGHRFSKLEDIGDLLKASPEVTLAGEKSPFYGTTYLR